VADSCEHSNIYLFTYIFICILFNGNVSILDDIASNYVVMRKKFERMWKEAVVAYLEVLSMHLPGGTKESTKPIRQDNRCCSRDSNQGL
jgi:hypothetical protein